MKLTLAEIADCLQVVTEKNCELTGVSIDSRQVKKGDLFVCLPGEHVDGHNFAARAVNAGAAAILASHAVDVENIPVLLVPDTERALGRLAAYWRQKTRAKVVCITGTSGKTTLKEALASILSRHGKISATRDNQNNQIGLPLSILNADGDEDYWVMELGISHPGDMEYLGDIIRPDLAIILNVGPGHTEGLGVKGVAWHKAQLLRFLALGGKGLVNAAYPDLVMEASKLNAETVFFGKNNEPFHLVQIPNPGTFKLRLLDEECSIKTLYECTCSWENVLAAAAAVKLLGISALAMEADFAQIKLPERRFAKARSANYIIYDDTYNANPLSMQSMLEGAADSAAREKAQLIAVLGEMGELGADAARWHYKLGQWLKERHVEVVFWKGNFEDDVRRGLGEEGKRLISASTSEEFLKKWQKINPGNGYGVVLFKGSRLNHLESYLDALRNHLESGDALNVL